MSKEIISLVKKNFERLQRLNEENVKVLVVVEVLKMLGYDPLTFDFEHPVYHRKSYADIAIQVSKDEYLYVEAKSGNHDLIYDDIIQITTYLTQRGVEWGILTNGKEYVLINSKIDHVKTDEEVLIDKIVFKVDLSTNKEVRYLEYFSKEAIFDRKTVYYFRDIAQFRAYKYPKGKGSWDSYKGTLYNFFSFYAQKENKYRPLKEIRVDDFQDFLNFEQKLKAGSSKSINALNTFNNKYSHIRSMFNELKKRDKIGSHHFEEERKKLATSLNYSDTTRNDSYLDAENVKRAFEFLEKTESSTRNIVIFLFSIYMGLERSVIRELNWQMLDLSKRCINIDGRKIILPGKLVSLLEKLYQENKKNGIKGEYLFHTYYGKKYNRITESGINAIYDSLSRIDESDEKWKNFSPQYIRNCLAIQLFENGYAIEEIAYLIGMDLVNIAGLISFDVICKNVNLKKEHKKRIHPFESILE